MSGSVAERSPGRQALTFVFGWMLAACLLAAAIAGFLFLMIFLFGDVWGGVVGIGVCVVGIAATVYFSAGGSGK